MAILISYFKRLRIQKKLLLIVASTSLLVILICGIAFSSMSQMRMREMILREVESIAAQRSEQFRQYIDELNVLAYTVMYSNWAQELLGGRYLNPSDEENARSNISHFFSSLSSVFDDIRFILFSKETVVAQNYSNLSLRHGYSVETMPWHEELLNTGKYIRYETPTDLFYNAREPMLSFFYPVYSIYNRKVMGYLMVGITAEVLGEFEDYHSDYYAINIIDESDRPIISTKDSLEGSEGDMNHEKFLSYRTPLTVDGWYLEVSQIGQRISVTSIKDFSLILWIVLPVVGLCLLIVGMFSNYLTKPILQCKDATLQIRENHFDIKIHNTYQDEIGELIDGLNSMAITISNLIDENRLIYLLKRDAELEALQQKINPHMLYNTLETMNAMILEHENTRAMRLCENLGRMFRYNLDGRRWVTIRDECEQLRLYLTILANKNAAIQFECHIDEGLEKCEMPKMIMQPIVENSLKHGLIDGREGSLTVRVCREDELIRITIMDNGAGMEEDELNELLASLRCEESSRRHVGLHNVYQRLQLEYGSDMQFTMFSVKGRGMRTEFTIPMVRR